MAQQAPVTTTYEELGADCTSLLLAQLDEPCQVASFARTCKAWKTLADRPEVWAGLCERNSALRSVMPVLLQGAEDTNQMHPGSLQGSPSRAIQDISAVTPRDPSTSGGSSVLSPSTSLRGTSGLGGSAAQSLLCYKTLCRQAKAMAALKVAKWEIVRPKAADVDEPRSKHAQVPRAREGHAAASWGTSSMILFGGWGGGIRQDLYILDRIQSKAPHPTPVINLAGSTHPRDDSAAPRTSLRVDQNANPVCGGSGTGSGSRWMNFGSGGFWGRLSAGSTGSSSSGSRSSSESYSSACMDECGASGAVAAVALPARPEYRWRVPLVAGTPPAIRYGHTATRCGAKGECLFIFGGMRMGGYMGEMERPGLLRPFSGAPSKGDRSSVTTPSPEAARSFCTRSTAATAPATAANGGSSMLAAAEPASPEYEYEWFTSALAGDFVGARGYHAAAASEDGSKVYIFGGIAQRDSIAALAVVDIAAWSCKVPETSGDAPSPRFGCSATVFRDRLWIVGGGYGHDLARSGHDLGDVHVLDLATMVWSRVVTANALGNKTWIGRCHASARVGSKHVVFGGSLDFHNMVTWLDLDSLKWGTPDVFGKQPSGRMSAVMVPSGADLLTFGGWIYHAGELGDVHRMSFQLE